MIIGLAPSDFPLGTGRLDIIQINIGGMNKTRIMKGSGSGKTMLAKEQVWINGNINIVTEFGIKYRQVAGAGFGGPLMSLKIHAGRKIV